MHTTKTLQQLTAMQKRGAQYLLVCSYGIAGYEQGEVLSWHKSHDAACRADAKADPGRCHMSVVDIADALADCNG